MKKNKEENKRIAYQSHFFTNNSLFKIGRAGQKRLTECTWEGKYTQDKCTTNYKIEAEGTRTMNGFDQDVFLLILYLHRLQNKSEKKEGNHADIDPNGIAELNQHVVLNVCSHEIIKMLSWPRNPNSYTRLHNSLVRLSRVYLLCHANTKEEGMLWSSHLLRFQDYRFLKKETRKNKQRLNLELSVCPLLTMVAQTSKADIHSSHIIQERLQLSPAAKIIHGAICSKLRAGKTQRFKTETLLTYMVEDVTKLSSKEYQRAILAIIELRDLKGWDNLHDKDSDTWEIERPKIGS